MALIATRDVIQEQIVSNFVTAGIVKQEEAVLYLNKLIEMDMRELLITLVESHEAREKAKGSVPYYHASELGMN